MSAMIVVDENKCLGCGQCALVCDFEAIEVRYGLSRIKQPDCVACGTCLDFCPLAALAWGEE